jgi:hypothetical protein
MREDILTVRAVALKVAIESTRMMRLNGGDLIPTIMREEDLDPKMAEMVRNKLIDLEEELGRKLDRLQSRR